jgi:hypothetical protein
MSGGADSFDKFCCEFARAFDSKVDGFCDLEKYWGTERTLTTWYEENVLRKPIQSYSLRHG